MLASSERGEDLRSALDEDGVAFPAFGTHPVQFVDVFPRTADQKIHLVPQDLDTEASCRGGLYHYEPDPGSAEWSVMR